MKKMFGRMILTATALNLALTSGAWGATSRMIYAAQACDSRQLYNEPLNHVPYYASPEWQKYFNEAKVKSYFAPERNKSDFARSGISRDTVSSSQIVNIVVDGLHDIQNEINEQIGRKKVNFLYEGQTTSEAESLEKMKAMDQLRKEKIDPMISQLYQVYLKAMRTKKAKASHIVASPEFTAFMTKARVQGDLINQAIQRIEPSLKAKLGDVIPVTGTDLPLSYRDGYVVKIRFQKQGETKTMTVYPTMIYDELTGDEEFFLNALGRWKEYCESQWQAARALTQVRGLDYIWQYVSALVAKWTGKSQTSPKDLIRWAPYMELAARQAEQDYQDAQWVRARLSQFSNEELYGLLDIFKALRYGDLPRCQNEIQVMNNHFITMLHGAKYRGQNSSAAFKAGSPEKKAIDAFAKDLAFYEDAYKVYSTTAAKLLETRPK